MVGTEFQYQGYYSLRGSVSLGVFYWVCFRWLFFFSPQCSSRSCPFGPGIYPMVFKHAQKRCDSWATDLGFPPPLRKYQNLRSLARSMSDSSMKGIETALWCGIRGLAFHRFLLVRYQIMYIRGGVHCDVE